MQLKDDEEPKMGLSEYQQDHGEISWRKIDDLLGNYYLSVPAMMAGLSTYASHLNPANNGAVSPLTRTS